LVVSNIVTPNNKMEVQAVIKDAISKQKKVLLKENLDLGAPAVSEKTVILDLKNLNKIIDLDKENFTVTVEGGINFLELQTVLAEKGFYFPIDTYAGAHTSLTYNVLHGLSSYTLGRYGNYREFVLGIEAVLFNGDFIKIGGKNIKNVSGLDIIGLMIGSKETLGIITGCTLRLLPLPEEKRVLICNFSDLKTALEAAGQLNDIGINPSRLQIINAQGSLLLKNKNNTKSPAIIAEIEGFKASMERKLALFKNTVARFAGASCQEISDKYQIKDLWDDFRELEYQMLTKAVEPIAFSSFLSNLSAMAGELDTELAKVYPEHIILVNGPVGSGLLIPLQKVDSGWAEKVGVITEKYQGNILGRPNFKDPGMNIIRARIIKAFDPADISFFGGEEHEYQADKLSS